ncbi:roadblock/LC7 domain-containing protein [Deinococcus aerophilus]|uniref:Roadblock/LAMTOR2 domain-containing protein n=1 Tax=Deinococcus aerophilus TaxID=522488 RepID=A0ABQ2GZL6_9DEIO|nr:roadblock/LC7 domain-containing protein [Deinococcus aerophilus]GGM19547.1 hypothetical protein GCM10010841_29500 [Deinococcus aerophilus]
MIGALLDVRGVRHAVLLDRSGSVVSSAGADRGTLDPAVLSGEQGLARAGHAVVGSLQGHLGGEWQDLLLDVDGGPVLLTPHGDQLLLTAFDDVASLGRVRFAVRRLLGTA